MILTSKETTLAYRCPSCGKVIFSVVGVFALSGDLLKLKCDCGGSELIITHTSDDKVRLTVPCIFCPTPHNYVISKTAFFDRDIFALACTYSGMDICFIGQKDRIIEAVEDSTAQLQQMLAEAGIEDLSAFRGGEEGEERFEFDDPQIEDIVRFMLCELRDDETIHCRCGHPAESDYGFDFIGEDLRVFCRTCGSYARIPMTSLDAAQRFLELDELSLPEQTDPNDLPWRSL